MGLLLSILITCVGVLEVIACYTHFRLGVTYNECKTNIKHVARYYALELRKHELHFEPGPDDPGPSTSKDTLSQLLMKNKQNLNENIDDNSYQLKVNNGHVHSEIGSPNPAANLKVPRNSISGSGLDSPTVQKLLSPEVDITEAVEKIQHLDELRHASGLEVVRKDFWRSRSPSPFPESDSGVETKSPDLPESPRPPTNEIEERNYWNKSLESVDDSGFSKTDLEVQNITEKISRQPSPYPDVLFGITAENIDEETRFDEAFLRSLDGVKSSRCDDKRRSFRKKRNSSSTSSRASEISRSLTSLDDIDNIERLDMKKISPLTEEIEDKSDIFLEKCDSITSPIPEDTKEANVTNQEQTKFEAKVTPNANSNSQEGKTNLSFTEKVKDLEISVQLLVTVKGTSQGDKMEYTTTVNPPKSQNEEKQLVKEEITKSTEEKSEFGNVKTSVTYGTGPNEDTTNLKDLQISSQSLIHSERTVQDDVSSSEAEFLKLYESFSELPDRQKDEFLNLIGQSKPEEVENEEIISEDDINEEVARITENIPKSILKKIPEIKEDNLDLPENLPKGTSEIIRSMSPFRSDEKIHITEITEITESTESVITIPPENQKNGESSDATIELLTSDKTIDSVQVPTKECDQDSVENKQVIIDMNTENKSESRIVSTEKIEQPILTNGNQTETKVVSTVTTKEPQVVRQLTSKPQKSSDDSRKTIEDISENKLANKNTNNIEQHVVEQIEQPESTTFENIINKQQTPIQNEDVNISSTIVDETIKTTDEISNEKTKVSCVISEECTGITTVQQQEPLLRTNTEQLIIELENVPNKNDINIVETATIIEQQVSSPNTFVQETIQQKTTTTEEEVPLNKETVVQHITEQQTKTSKEDIPITNENIVQEITIVTTTVQDSIPKTVVEQKTEQQTTLKEDMPVTNDNTVEEITTVTTTIQDMPATNDNIVEDITTLTTIVPQNSIAATVVEQKIDQQITTVKEDIPVTDDNIVEKITTVTTTVQQKSTPETVVQHIIEQQTTTSKEDMPVMNDKMVEEITTVTTTVQHESIPETQPEQIPVQNENTNTILEQTTTVSKISTPEVIQQQTPTQETKTPIEHTNSQKTNALPIPDEQSKPTTPTETKIETSKKETKPESSSESSSTPSTVIETQLRRASKTSFEDASPVQNQMMTRKLSNSDISPKQASQAFWLIFSAEYTNAMEKDWHGQHFSCWQCDESLTGQRYVLRDDHPYCVKCYEQVFANPCEKCNRIIGIDSKDLSYKDKHWHEACFQCTTCSESLVDKQFGAKGEKIYCGNCYDKQFASRCDGCGKIFHAGTKKMEYKNRQWHEQCFRCCKCETPIGTKSFIPREKDIYCAGCYEEKFATRCVKCDKAIQSGGVTYKNEPWHRECFTCTHCNKNLAGQRFTSRDDKPCCADCFGKLFAKRCTSCAEPITGIGGTRFISFEDRHWHNDCFICASCTTSLVGRGFITDEDKIICPECAKERFM